MSTHACARCGGHGYLCKTCLKVHEPRGSFFRTRCRGRKTIPCPGAVVKPKDGEIVKVGPVQVIPCFSTWTECDVCRVSRRGDFHVKSYNTWDSGGWDLLNVPGGKTIYLCPSCKKRHEEIRTMTLEYLMTERCGLRGGQWVDRNGALLPDAKPSGASTPQPRSETP